MHTNMIHIFYLVILLVITGCEPQNPSDPSDPSDPPSNPDMAVLSRLHDLHNEERGTNDLKANKYLMAAAQKHADWMANNNNMSHTGDNGSNFWMRINNEGYNGLSGGENIAYGYTSADDVFQGWMRSDGHRNNILNPRWKESGYGMAIASNNRIYWCTVFADPAPQGIEAIVDPTDLALPDPLVAED